MEENLVTKDYTVGVEADAAKAKKKKKKKKKKDKKKDESEKEEKEVEHLSAIPEAKAEVLGEEEQWNPFTGSENKISDSSPKVSAEDPVGYESRQSSVAEEKFDEDLRQTLSSVGEDNASPSELTVQSSHDLRESWISPDDEDLEAEKDEGSDDLKTIADLGPLERFARLSDVGELLDQAESTAAYPVPEWARPRVRARLYVVDKDDLIDRNPIGPGCLKSMNRNVMAGCLMQFSSMPMERIHHFALNGEFMHALYRDKKLVDVLIHIEDRIYYAHRNILCAHSDYFAGTLMNNDIPPFTVTDITLKNIDATLFKRFVHFAYTGDIFVNMQNVQQLKKLAHMLQSPTLKARLMTFLSEMHAMDLPEALHILSNRLDVDEKPMAIEVVKRNFSTALNDTDSLCRFSAEDLLDIISADNLCVNAELDVFWAVLFWVAGKPGIRINSLDKLMSQVRFTRMSSLELLDCARVSKLVRLSKLCKKMLVTANWVCHARETGLEDPLRLPVQPQRVCLAGGPRYEPTVAEFDHRFLKYKSLMQQEGDLILPAVLGDAYKQKVSFDKKPDITIERKGDSFDRTPSPSEIWESERTISRAFLPPANMLYILDFVADKSLPFDESEVTGSWPGSMVTDKKQTDDTIPSKHPSGEYLESKRALRDREQLEYGYSPGPSFTRELAPLASASRSHKNLFPGSNWHKHKPEKRSKRPAAKQRYQQTILYPRPTSPGPSTIDFGFSDSPLYQSRPSRLSYDFPTSTLQFPSYPSSPGGPSLGYSTQQLEPFYGALSKRDSLYREVPSEEEVLYSGVYQGIRSPGVYQGIRSPGVYQGIISPGVYQRIISPGVYQGIRSPGVGVYQGIRSPGVGVYQGIRSPGVYQGIISPGKHRYNQSPLHSLPDSLKSSAVEFDFPDSQMYMSTPSHTDYVFPGSAFQSPYYPSSSRGSRIGSPVNYPQSQVVTQPSGLNTPTRAYGLSPIIEYSLPDSPALTYTPVYGAQPSQPAPPTEVPLRQTDLDTMNEYPNTEETDTSSEYSEDTRSTLTPRLSTGDNLLQFDGNDNAIEAQGSSQFSLLDDDISVAEIHASGKNVPPSKGLATNAKDMLSASSTETDFTKMGARPKTKNSSPAMNMLVRAENKVTKDMKKTKRRSTSSLTQVQGEENFSPNNYRTSDFEHGFKIHFHNYEMNPLRLWESCVDNIAETLMLGDTILIPEKIDKVVLTRTKTHLEKINDSPASQET